MEEFDITKLEEALSGKKRVKSPKKVAEKSIEVNVVCAKCLKDCKQSTQITVLNCPEFQKA